MCSGICEANLNALAHISALAIALAGILSTSHSYRSVKSLEILPNEFGPYSFSALFHAAPEYYALSPSCSTIPP